MTKRILSLVMVLCMMLSMVPAFADMHAATTNVANMPCALTAGCTGLYELKDDYKGTKACVLQCSVCKEYTDAFSHEVADMASGRGIWCALAVVEQTTTKGTHNYVCNSQFCKGAVVTTEECSIVNGACTVCKGACDHTELKQEACDVAVECPVCDEVVYAAKDHVAAQSSVNVSNMPEYAGYWEGIAAGHAQKCVTCNRYFNYTDGASYETLEAAIADDGHTKHWYKLDGAETDYTTDAEGHIANCVFCGWDDAKEEHTYGAYVGSKKVCSVCDYEVTCTEHVLLLNAEGTKLECTICDFEKADACTEAAHNWKTYPGYAADCDEEDGHPGETEEIKCTICGAYKKFHTEFEAKHDYEKTLEIAATCKTTGKYLLKCKKCGHISEEIIEYKGEALKDEEGYTYTKALLAHGKYMVFDKIIAKPTCEKAGTEQWKCTNCGLTFTKKIAKLAHNFDAIITDYAMNEDGSVNFAVELDVMDCDGGIWTYIGCTNKVDVDGDGDIDFVCDETKSEAKRIPNTTFGEHTLVYVKDVKGTCTKPGGELHKCGNTQYCELTWILDEDGEVAEPTGKTVHEFDGEPIIKWVTEDTCTTKGEYKLYCPVEGCGAQIDAEGKDYTKSLFVDDIKHTNSVDDLKDFVHTGDHDAVPGWIYTDPTCQKLGYWESNCRNCHNNYLKVVDEKCAVTHSFTKAGKFVEDITGMCKDYPNTIKQAKAEVICAYCGLPQTDEKGKAVLAYADVEHNWVLDGAPIKAATCSKDGYGAQKCTICGSTKYDVIEATGKCQYVYTKVEPNCEHGTIYGWYCAKCGDEKCIDSEILTDKRAHKFEVTGSVEICGFYAPVVEEECAYADCDETRYTYTYNGADVTDIIGNDCTAGKVIIKESCENDGLKDMATCKVCGLTGLDYTGDRYVTIPGGHKPAEGVVVETIKDCVETYQKFYCVNCKKDIYKKISADKDIENHRTIKWDETVPYTCTEAGFGYEYCADCGWKSTVGETIPAACRFDKNVYLTVKPATCGEDGVGQLVCTVCGKENTDPQKGFITLKKNGAHNFVKYVRESGTCLYESYVIYECSICKQPETDAKKLAALGYKYDPNTINGKKLTFTYLDVNGNQHATSNDLINVIETIGYKNDSHEYGVPELKPATCMYAGGMRKVCKVCGFEKLVGEATAPKLAHDEVVVTVPATCYVDGSKTTYCYVCGEIVKPVEKLPKFNHEGIAPDTKDSRNVKATCKTTGIAVYACPVEGCPYEYLVATPKNAYNHVFEDVLVMDKADCVAKKDGLAWQKCVYCGEQSINAIPYVHTWDAGVVTVEPTCAEEGVKKFTCTLCKVATKEETVARVAHSMVTKEQAADCINDAGIVTKCENCNLVTSFIKTGAKALGHKWSAKTFVKNSCGKDGGYSFYCLRCETPMFEKDPNYPALSHKILEDNSNKIKSVKATCSEGGYDLYLCPVCNTEFKANEVDANVTAHNYVVTDEFKGTVACNKPGFVDLKCTLCNATVSDIWYTPKHTMSSYVYTTDYIYRYCVVCGEIESLWVSDTFGGFKGCTVIGVNEEGKRALVGGHAGLVIKAGKEGTCEEAGQIEHIECTVCKTIIQQGAVIPAHNVTVIEAKAATCTAEGNTAGKYCETCKEYIVKPETIAKVAHTPVEVPAVDATATTAGTTAGKKCSVCGEILEGCEPVAKLGASVKRLCVVRSKAADYREDPTSVVVEMLAEGTKVTITGELTNEYYPVGEGRFIHMSYITVA